jgi:hypothetical protein
MYIGGERILKREVKKYRSCMGRTISLSVLSFMLFFVSIAGILPSVEGEGKNIVLFFIIIFFILHILLVLYSLLKLNSYIYLYENKIVQKQFGKIINIKYDEINDVKLSFSFYVRAFYGIKIYNNNKKIMFEITSKVFDEFMKCCSNIEVKHKLKNLLKEIRKEIPFSTDNVLNALTHPERTNLFTKPTDKK